MQCLQADLLKLGVDTTAPINESDGLPGMPRDNSSVSDSSVSRLQAEISQLPDIESVTHSAQQRLPAQSGISSLINSAVPAMDRSWERDVPGCRSLRHMRHTQSSFSRVRPKSAPPRGRSQQSGRPDAAFTMLQSTQYDRGASHRHFARLNGHQHDQDATAGDCPTMRTLRLTPEEQAALYARNMRWRYKVEKRLESLRQEKEETEVSECTFRPCLQTRRSRPPLQVLESHITSGRPQLPPKFIVRCCT